MPVTQYPHTATVVITTDSGEDENGYPLPPVTQTVELICRAEPNTQNAVVYAPDGTAFQFKYVIYVKAGQSDVPVNSNISIALENGEVTGIVKMYSKGQLNARIWV
ncbi:MAG: hypothetical protein ACTHLB_05495 [Parafilimonas sp.]